MGYSNRVGCLRSVQGHYLTDYIASVAVFFSFFRQHSVARASDRVARFIHITNNMSKSQTYYF